MERLSESVEDTRKAGALAAREAQAGEVYGLIGELGCGKTEYVRGFVNALRPGCLVQSPSFTILNIYETPLFPVYHFDFYRLKKAGELVEIGFNEYLGEGVCLIEWADMFPEALPASAHAVQFFDKGNNRRVIVTDRQAWWAPERGK